VSERRENIFTLITGATRIFSPVDLYQCGTFTFTVSVTTTGTLTGTSVQLYGSNIGRADPVANTPPFLLGTSNIFSISPAVTGIADADASGNIALTNIASGTFERSYTVATFPRLVWFGVTYGSGGGTPSFSIAVGSWSF
jgi:hypothetical protein